MATEKKSAAASADKKPTAAKNGGKATQGKGGSSKNNTKRKSSRSKKQQGYAQEITGYCLIVLGIFSFAAVVLGGAGWLGAGIAKVMFGMFGMCAFVAPLLMTAIGWIVLVAKKMKLHAGKLMLTGMTVLMIYVLNHLIFDAKIQAAVLEAKPAVTYWNYIAQSYVHGLNTHLSSGALGGMLTYPLRTLLGNVGCWILTIALIIGCVFVLGKLSMRKTARTITDKTVETAKHVHESAQHRAEVRRERVVERKNEQTRLDLEAAGEMPVQDNRQSLRNEHVTGPAAGAEVQYNPLTREDEQVEVGEVYEAPGKKLLRFDILKKKKQAEPDEEEAIDIQRDSRRIVSEMVEEEPVLDVPTRVYAPVMQEEQPEPFTAQDDDLPWRDDDAEEDFVPLEIVPVAKPKPVEKPVEKKPEPKKIKFEPGFKNPSVSDFDDDPDDDSEIIEAAPGLMNITLKPKEISPASEVEYTITEESTPVIDPVAVPPYRFPPMTLLTQPKAEEVGSAHKAEEEQQERVELLEETLSSFGIEARVINVARGPAITRYELQPARGVKVSKITGLSDDIALNMAAAGGVRIEAPIPGKAAVGIEIANSSIATVTLREVLESNQFQTHASKLAVALGKDIAGTPVVADLARMPHLLIAGATGSGKSVCINSIIASILYKATPDEVKLILIDHKVVELSVYNGIPHLLIPVVTDPKKAAGALGWAVQEMTDRYKKFEGAAVRDLKGYNRYAVKNGWEPMPQIVVIIDELADLMMVAQNDVETKICRLTQLARAAGIHLVIATQRPSVDVITGLIKANVPSRIAFAVASQVDSRTILNVGGAEKLLGRGDMLFDPSGASKSIRVQGAFISDDEVTELVEFVKEKTTAQYDENVIEMLERAGEDTGKKGKKDKEKEEDVEEEGNDPLLMDCIELAIDAGQISASMIQRKHRVGYARAGRILDQMEQKGAISGFEGSKPRQTLITREQFYEMSGREPSTMIYNSEE